MCKCDGDFTGVHCNESKYHFIRIHFTASRVRFKISNFDVNFKFFISRLSMIVRVNVVLNRTVVDSD